MSVSTFHDALKGIAARVPEMQVAMIIGTDGIPVDKLLLEAPAHAEAVAAEYTSLLRDSVSASADAGLGSLRELSVVADKMSTLMIAITPDYFLFAAFRPDVLQGRARFAMRLAAIALEAEFR
jgi:predicted regulator of Ras-like GTPase activity (Roadblock/LC7/MglB family)